MKTILMIIICTFSLQLISQKVTIKDVDDNILIEINDEGKTGSITLLPDTIPGDVDHKLYNVNNALYWHGTRLGMVNDTVGWEVGPGIIYPADLSSRVGIGTATPDPEMMLDVQKENEGTNTISPVALFRTVGEGNSAGAIRLENAYGHHFNIGVTKNPTNSFAINYESNISQNSDILRITPAGRVGIGAGDPTRNLEVRGSTTEDVAITIRNLNTAGSERIYFGLPNSGDAGIKVYGSTTPGATQGRYEFFNRRTGAYFYWTLNGFPKMTLDHEGELGIGTIEPYARLHVRQEDSEDAFRVDDQWNDPTPFIVNESGYVGIGITNPGAKAHVIHTDSGPAFRVDDESTDNTPFVIDQLGNIGIGTPSPLCRMEILDDSFRVRYNYDFVESFAYQYGGILCDDFKNEVKGYLAHSFENFTGTYKQNMGVYGAAKEPNVNSNIGLYGQAEGGSHNYGIYGSVGGEVGSRLAGFFQGDVEVTGSLSKGGGSFKIDHPLDPENKYLYHSFVESPDMMNIYNGNVILDEQGRGTVELPDWFGALNKDFRYQLTAIGAPGPGLYIAKKVRNNRFMIAGGSPGMEVSWLVTGIRDDAYARKNRIQVEVDKATDNQGSFLHPDAFGKPENMKEGYELFRMLN